MGLALEKVLVTAQLNCEEVPSLQTKIKVHPSGLHSPKEKLKNLDFLKLANYMEAVVKLFHSPCQRGEIGVSPLIGWLGCPLQGTAGHLPLAGTLVSGELSKTVPASLIEM